MPGIKETEPGVTVIEPSRAWMPLNLAEIWRFRELVYFLAWRDVLVKYKQTALGVAWAVIQPVLAMVVFSALFGRYGKLPSDGAPYPIFVYIGLLPWNYFASVVNQSTSSLASGANLITKIYFPRLILPASSAIAALLDLVIGSVVLGGLMVYYGVGVGRGALLLPVLLLVTVMNAVGFGMWFSALNVRYRDIQYAVPFLMQIWMFLTPVIYPVSLVGKSYRWLLMLNPMGGVIEAFRVSVLGHAPLPWAALAISTGAGALVFIGGAVYFRSVERHFADII
jgi:lipopolysaccharide transport system permease protein